MQIGIFAKTFVRPTLDATLDAVVAHGLHCVQFNLACAGVPSMPEQIEPALVDTIRRELATRQITMAALSGTFNMIHPDLGQRRDGMRRLRVLAAACAGLDTWIITLCTGTRDPDNMWRRHRDNDTPAAWWDLVAAMTEAVAIAEEYNVVLAFEPEISNVVDTAGKARRLLDELRSPHLKVVIDGANLFHAGELPRMHAVLAEAFALLGEHIVIAHAKDLRRDGAAGDMAAGQGLLDYDHYLASLRAVGFSGPVILHGLAESQVDNSVAFLREKLARNTSSGAR